MSSDSAVRFVRLKTGDDLISEVVEFENELRQKTYQLINPLKIVYIAGSGQSYMSVAFTPWVIRRMCDKQSFDINSNDILVISEVTEGMDEYYYSTQESFNSINNEQTEDIYYDEVEEDSVSEQEDDESQRVVDLLSSLLTSKRTYH